MYGVWWTQYVAGRAGGGLRGIDRLQRHRDESELALAWDELRVTVRKIRVRVRVRGSGSGRGRGRCFVVTRGLKGVLCVWSVAEGGGTGAVSGLWLERRLCSMLTVMLGGDLDVATRV